MMTERERLIELIKNGFFTEPVYGVLCTNKRKASEYLADYLLENGVFVPLVNKNDTVYTILSNQIFGFKVIHFNFYILDFYFNKGRRGLPFLYKFQNKDFGKTIFLTIEEAEKALVKMKGGAEE